MEHSWPLEQGKWGAEGNAHLVLSCATECLAHTLFLLFVSLLACLFAIRRAHSLDNLEKYISIAKRWVTWFAYFLNRCNASFGFYYH